jgi:hypothetical protein
MKKILILVFIISGILLGQKKDPDKILQEVIKSFNKVQDYTVNVNIKVDVPFLKAPDTEAKIYFKQPDKIHFASDKFALLPKEGLDFSPMGLLKKDYTALYIKEDEINGTSHSVIKIIPTEDRGDVILSTLWINNNLKAISKVESSTKTSGTFVMELFYDSKLKYPLPSKMLFSFNFSGMGGQRHPDPDDLKAGDKKDEPIKGKVYITYSDYQVNQGIPDSIFEKKPEKK